MNAQLPIHLFCNYNDLVTRKHVLEKSFCNYNDLVTSKHVIEKSYPLYRIEEGQNKASRTALF